MSSQLPDMEGGGRPSRSVAGDLVRPRYSPGLILEDRDLTAAVDYTRNLSRLLFRSLLGCGVVCGLKVDIEDGSELTVTVAPGLALDGCGDPVQLVSPVAIGLGRPERPSPKRTEFWVVIGGGERRGDPRELVCDADEIDIHSQPTRIRSTAEVSIHFARPECLCWRRPEPDSASGDCPPDGGCGAGCDCDCGVLLAQVQWVEGKWVAKHGERRFLRPVFAEDPVAK